MTTAKPTPIHPVIATVTERIRQRSAHSRAEYLAMVEQAGQNAPQRKGMGLRQPGSHLCRIARPRQAGHP